MNDEKKKKRSIGSYRQRGENIWELSVSAGKGMKGKRNRPTKTVKCKEKDVEKQLALFIAEVEKGQYIEPSKLTLEEFSKRWIRDYADKNLAPMTRAGYLAKLEKRILPALGHFKLEQIKPLHLSDFFSNLKEDGLRLDGKEGGMGTDSIIQCHRVLSSILKLAVSLQMITENPCMRVKAPHPPKRNLSVWDENQTMAALVALQCKPEAMRTIITMAALTGLRRGEILGLEWKHIDFEKRTARIVQVSQNVTGTGVITKEPKTASSTRLLALPEMVCNLLKTHKAVQNEKRLKLGSKWVESDRLFVTWNGRPMHPNTVNKWMREFISEYNEERDEVDCLPVIRFHDLRHSAATIMITQGIDVGTVAKNLGHSRPSITTDIYYNALMTAQERAAIKMNDLFSGAVK